MWGMLAKFAVSAVLIFLLLRGHNLHGLIDQIGAVDRKALVVAAVCYAAVALPSALRWSIVVASMGRRLAFRQALPIVLIGYFFNLTLISSIGGDIVRIWKAYRAGLPSGIAASSVIIERLAQVLAHFLIIAASIPLLFARIPNTFIRAAVVVLVLLGAVGFAALLTLDRWPAPLQKLLSFGAFAQFAKYFRRVLLVPATAVPVVFLGFVNQMTTVVVVAILSGGLHLPVGFVDCLIIAPAAFLLTAVPVSIAGWGVREGAFIVGFSYVGLASADALSLSLLFGLLNTAVRLPGALIWLAMPDKRVPQTFKRVTAN